MKGDAGFCHLIGAPGQQRRDRDAVRIRGDHCHHFAVVAAVVRGQARNAGDGELRACQRFLGQFVHLYDFDAALDGLVGGADCRGFVGTHNAVQGHQIGHISGGVSVFLHQVLAFPQRWGFCHAFRVGGHGGGQAGAVFVIVVNVELHARDRGPVQGVGFHQLNPALGGFVLNRHFDGFHVVLDDYLR